jgi:hypothetical protein
MQISNNKHQIPNKSQNTMTQIPNLVPPFSKGGKGDFLEFRIWILFVICYLLIGAWNFLNHGGNRT